MKKSNPLPNPVLHFGPEVAKDIIKKECLDHFEKGFRKKEQGNAEIYAGLLVAMKNSRDPVDVRNWLLQTCRGRKSEVTKLMVLYYRIWDSEEHRKKFVEGIESFLEASFRPHNSASSKEELFERRLYNLVVSAESLFMPDEVLHQRLTEKRDSYRENKGWV